MTDDQSMIEIVPGRLWQSGSPIDWEGARQRGIDVVIDVNGDGDRRIEADRWFPAESLLYVFWPITDGRLPNETVLHLVADFVAALIDTGKKALVLCSAGVNRSGLLSGLVVRNVERLSGEAATAHLRERHPRVLSNPVFFDYVSSLPAPELDALG